jgi:hypothetical protein
VRSLPNPLCNPRRAETAFSRRMQTITLLKMYCYIITEKAEKQQNHGKLTGAGAVV